MEVKCGCYKKIKAQSDSASGTISRIAQPLGLKKTSVLDEKILMDEIIEENYRLRARLKAISFRTKKISQEQMASEQRKVAMFILKLSDYDIISTMSDTREIDRALYELCDELQEAYRKGDELTAHYIGKTLCYAILRGHSALTENEKKHEADVMKRREKNVQNYLKAVQASQKLYLCRELIEENRQKMQENDIAVKNKIKEIEDLKKHPDGAAAFAILMKAPVPVHALHGTALELALKMKEVVHLYKENESLKKQISLNEIEINNYQEFFSQMESIFHEFDQEAKSELMEYSKCLGNQLVERVNNHMNDILESQAPIEAYFKSIESVFQQPWREDEFYVVDEYELMKRKFEEDKATFGRILEREKMNFQELEDIDNE